MHVPGQYSGGSAAQYTWTQKKGELEVRIPLPEGTADGSVKCSILPRAFSLTTGLDAENAVAGGQLMEVVVVGDSLWSVERDGANAVAVVSLRKAVPDLWTRLLTSEAEPAEPPKLLDGIARKAPATKEALLRQAKERAKGALDGPSKAAQHVVEGKSGEIIELLPAALPPLPVVTVRNCTDCEVVLSKGLAAG